MQNKIFEFLQKNYGWMVAAITGIGVTTSFILGLLYNFEFYILTLLCFYSLMYCYIQLFNTRKLKLI